MYSKQKVTTLGKYADINMVTTVHPCKETKYIVPSKENTATGVLMGHLHQLKIKYTQCFSSVQAVYINYNNFQHY